METKRCSKCKENKSYSEYSISRATKDGVQHTCKFCDKKRKALHRRTKQGVIKTIYSTQRSSSKYRNHPLPTYSRDELKEWVFSQPIFHELYDKWVKSGYNRWEKPSCDRIDDYKGYSFDNIQLMTWGENSLKGNQDQINGVNTKMSKSVSQYSMSGELVNTFHSQHHAGRETGIQSQNINKCCSGKRNHAGGFIWRYTNP
jgi:hypothetical protein